MQVDNRPPQADSEEPPPPVPELIVETATGPAVTEEEASPTPKPSADTEGPAIPSAALNPLGIVQEGFGSLAVNKTRQLEIECQTLQVENQRLVQCLKDKDAALRGENHELSSVTAERDQLFDKVWDLELEVDKLQTASKTLLKSKVSTMHDLNLEIAALGVDLDFNSVTDEMLSEAHRRAAQAEKSLAYALSELDDSNAQRDMVQFQLNTMESQFSQLQVQCEAMKTWYSELQDKYPALLSETFASTVPRV